MQTPSSDNVALNRRIGTSIDAKVRERLAISASDRPTPISELRVVSFALAGIRWIVLLLFQYPMQHPSGYRGWLRETAFVAAIVVAAIAGAVLRRWY